MKFTINRKYLSDKLTIVSRAISMYSPLPALSGIWIEVMKDKIQLTGSDSTISIQSTIYPDEINHLHIEQTGSIIVESKYLQEIVRKMDFDTIEFELMDTTLLRISNKQGVFHLNGIESNAYPELDFYQPKTEFKLSKNQLRTIVTQTAFACSDKDSRPVLTGINFKAIDTQLFCSATDTYRLARKIVQLEQPMDFNITISQKSLGDVVKSLETMLTFLSTIKKCNSFSTTRCIKPICWMAPFRMSNGSFRKNLSAFTSRIRRSWRGRLIEQTLSARTKSI